MAVIPRASAEELLGPHPGLAKKSDDGPCLREQPLDRGSDSSILLDATIADEFAAHYTTEGHLFVYRSCGKTACQAECALVINAAGKVQDFAPIGSPCTNNL